MILIAPARPSALRSLGSKLFGRRAAQPAEPTLVDEYEVYTVGRWDSKTAHAPVEHTGTRESCEAFLENSKLHDNCLNWKSAVRRTGQLMEAH